MKCESCGGEITQGAASCPECGQAVGTAPAADDVRADGGGAADPANTPSNDAAQGTGAAQRPPGHQRGLVEQFRAFLSALPSTGGALFGSLALLIPYGIINAVAIAVAEDEALSVGASLFFTIVEIGPGEKFVSELVRASSIESLRMVDPADYPGHEQTVEGAKTLVLNNPDSALLVLYLLFPVGLFVGGRALARRHATGGSLFDHAKVGTALAAGTLPVTLLVGLVFGVEDLLGRVFFVGLVMPVLIGAAGGLAVGIFGDDNKRRSRLAGWAGVALGLLGTYLLFKPTAQRARDMAGDVPGSEQFAEQVQTSAAQQVVHSVMAYLSTVSFRPGFMSDGVPILLAVVLATVLAGFLRVYLASDGIETRKGAARRGAMIIRGYLGAILVLVVALPLSTIFVDMSLNLNSMAQQFAPDIAGLAAQVMPKPNDVLAYLVLGGVLFPLLFGGLGGYLHRRYEERQGPQRQ